jgi:DNA-binding NarL/FixJ family response regulator
MRKVYEKGLTHMPNVSCIDDTRGVTAVRLLVVEDFEPFRRLLSSKLTARPELQVIGEVSDGIEAVCKAEELQPDLILLDVWLPTISGIEVARRIHKLSRNLKIVFVSQESSADVVEEAFRLGAFGYVVKTRVGTDLLPAIEAALGNRHFVSSGLLGHNFTKLTDAQVC